MLLCGIFALSVPIHNIFFFIIDWGGKWLLAGSLRDNEGSLGESAVEVHERRAVQHRAQLGRVHLPACQRRARGVNARARAPCKQTPDIHMYTHLS